MDVHRAGRSLNGYVCADRWDWRVFCVAQNRSLVDCLARRVIGDRSRRNGCAPLLGSRGREQYCRGEHRITDNLAAIEFHTPSPVRDTSASLNGLFSPDSSHRQQNTFDKKSLTWPSDVGPISLLQYSLTCGPFWEHTVKCVGQRIFEKWEEFMSACGGRGSNSSHP